MHHAVVTRDQLNTAPSIVINSRMMKCSKNGANEKCIKTVVRKALGKRLTGIYIHAWKVCGLFNDAVSNSDYTASNDRLIYE
jgi:aspartate 1-decarboxylase